MQKKSINFNKGGDGPSDYTIKLLLNFSKSVKVIELKKLKKIIMHCN